MERLRAARSRSSKPDSRSCGKPHDAGGARATRFLLGRLSASRASHLLFSRISVAMEHHAEGVSRTCGVSFIVALSAVQCLAMMELQQAKRWGLRAGTARYVLLAMVASSLRLSGGLVHASSLLEGELLVRGLCNSALTTLMSIIVIITNCTDLGTGSDGTYLNRRAVWEVEERRFRDTCL